jgi:hypothetical protein
MSFELASLMRYWLEDHSFRLVADSGDSTDHYLIYTAPKSGAASIDRITINYCRPVGGDSPHFDLSVSVTFQEVQATSRSLLGNDSDMVGWLRPDRDITYAAFLASNPALLVRTGNLKERQLPYVASDLESATLVPITRYLIAASEHMSSRLTDPAAYLDAFLTRDPLVGTFTEARLAAVSCAVLGGDLDTAIEIACHPHAQRVAYFRRLLGRLNAERER